MKESYITEIEQEKCEKVAQAFLKMYPKDDILVMNAGKYGYVKLFYYRQLDGFEDVTTFTDSQEMFDDLWQEWIQNEVLEATKGTALSELDYEDKVENLPEDKQKELSAKKAEFMALAGMEQ